MRLLGCIFSVVLAGQAPFVTSARAQNPVDEFACSNYASRDDAIGACTRIIESGGYRQMSIATALINRCAALAKTGGYDKAVADCNKALELSPDNARAYYFRGLAHIVDPKGRQDVAIADFTTVIRLTPNNADAYNLRAVAYKTAGKLEIAIDDYNEAIRLAPQVAGYRLNRGLAFAERGSANRAIEDFDAAISLSAANGDAVDITSRAHVSRGIANFGLGEYSVAISDFDQALKLKPGNANAYVNRGAAHARLGQYEQAISDYDKGLATEPKGEAAASLHYNGGTAFLRLKKYEKAIASYVKAIDSYDRAIQADPRYAAQADAQYAAAYNNRAWAHLKAGRPEKGLADVKESLRHEPNNAAAIDTRAQILKALGRPDPTPDNVRRAAELEKPSTLVVTVSERQLTPETVKLIAEIAQRISIDYKAGDTVRDVVTRACGRFDQLYFDFLKTEGEIPKGATAEKNFTANTAFANGGNMSLPFCLRLPERVTLRRGDRGTRVAVLQALLTEAGFAVTRDGKFDKNTLEEVKKFQLRVGLEPDGMVGPETMRAVQNSARWTGKHARTLGNKWVPASAVDVVEYVGRVPIPIKKGIPTVEVASLSSKFRLTLKKDVAGAPATRANTRKKSNKDLRLITSLTSTQLANTKECQLFQDKPNYPIVIDELIRVMGANATKSKKNRNPVAILVADSGLHGYGTAPLTEDRFAQEDEDKPDPLTKYYPEKNFKNHMHGTHVVSAAFGTPKLRHIMAILGFPIQVLPRNIVDRKRSEVIDDGKVKLVHEITYDLIDAAIGVDSQVAIIANLSFMGPEMSGVFTRGIERNERLYIVAAGNDSKLLNQDTDRPAILGGRNGPKSLITVGALNIAGGYADFSNYGPEHVELAAPGCSIPVYQFVEEPGKQRFEETRGHGTSMAAPLVAYTAALIRWYKTRWKPPRLKERLIVSADVVYQESYENMTAGLMQVADELEELNKSDKAGEDEKTKLELRKAAFEAKIAAMDKIPTKVFEGRVLNSAKALAVFHDVVTWNDRLDNPGDRPSFNLGKITKAPAKINLCGQPFEWKNLRKIVPRFRTHDGIRNWVKTLVYYTINKRMNRWQCAVKNDDVAAVKFTFTDTDGLDHKLTLADVREILFK